MTSSSSRTEALLLISTGCPYCANVLNSLEKQLKSGNIGKLTISNIEHFPETAESLGVRSVPWMRIGDFRLSGNHSDAEIATWVKRARAGTGMAAYITLLLQQQRLEEAGELIRTNPRSHAAIFELLQDPDTPLGIRIGISAIIEDLAGSPILKSMVPGFTRLLQSPEARIRADACHALHLSDDPQARTALETCRQDPDSEVREIALESLQGKE